MKGRRIRVDRGTDIIFQMRRRVSNSSTFPNGRIRGRIRCRSSRNKRRKGRSRRGKYSRKEEAGGEGEVGLEDVKISLEPTKLEGGGKG